MDLIRHLRFFVTVAEEGHFGRAAAVLDMTQPPLSQGLRKLEQHLGSELVHRTRQGAVLTPAGAELLPRARLLVDDADRFLAEAGRVARARGLLHWGATRALPDRLVTLCVTALRGCGEARGRGAATVSTRSASTVELVDAVRSGMCDLAVVEHPALTEGLDAGPVVKLRRWLVVPADHRSARSDRPRLPMLSDLTFAAPPRAGNPAAFDAVQDLLRERGLDVETTPAADDRAVLAAVAAGTHFGVSTSPPGSVPGVAWLDWAPAALALRVRIVRRPDTDVGTQVDALDRVLFKERVR